MAAMNDPLAAPAAAAQPSATSPARARPIATCWWCMVNNRPGVLNRVASLVRARNFNIESLAVGHTERPDISRMTITLRGDDFAVEQMEQAALPADRRAQGPGPARDRLDRARAGADQGARHRTASRAEVLKVVELYKGRVLDVGARQR